MCIRDRSSSRDTERGVWSRASPILPNCGIRGRIVSNQWCLILDGVLCIRALIFPNWTDSLPFTVEERFQVLFNVLKCAFMPGWVTRVCKHTPAANLKESTLPRRQTLTDPIMRLCLSAWSALVEYPEAPRKHRSPWIFYRSSLVALYNADSQSLSRTSSIGIVERMHEVLIIRVLL